MDGNQSPRWYFIEFENGYAFNVYVYDIIDAIQAASCEYNAIGTTDEPMEQSRVVKISAYVPKSIVDKLKDKLSSIFNTGTKDE